MPWKTTVSVATDDKARQQQQMMAWMLPLMFGFFALSFPSGVSLYWTVNSIVAIGFNIATYGLPILNIKPLFNVPSSSPAAATGPEEGGGKPPRAGPGTRESEPETRTTNGPGRSKRQNRRRRP